MAGKMAWLLTTLRMPLAAGAGVALFVAAFTLKRQLAPSDNALAECLTVLLVCMPIVALALVWLYRRSLLNLEATLGAALIFFLAASCFWLTVPAIFDRSVSLYLINLLDSSDQGLTEEEIRSQFIVVYFTESKGIEKRLNEQLEAGRLAYADGRYHITGKGRFTIGTARLLSRLYALDPKIVEPLDAKQHASGPAPP